MSTTLRSLAILALISTGACGDSLDVQNTVPRGSIGGLVVDAVTRMPIEGATVSVIAGGESEGPTTTKADGHFSINNVRAGDVLIMIDGPTDAGYQQAFIHGFLDDTAGNFPAHNTITLGIGLLSAGSDYTIRVLDTEGRPVSMYPVTLRHFVQYIDFSSGLSRNGGEVVMSATTGTDGRATFTGMPPFNALSPDINPTGVLLLPPVEDNGLFVYPGGSQTVNLRAYGDPSPDVILDPNLAASLTIRASTVADLYNPPGSSATGTVLGINDTIHVAFNLPLVDATVAVMDEAGTPLATQPSVTPSEDNLSIGFGQNPLSPGNEYNIVIHAVANVGDTLVEGDFSGAFFTTGVGDVTVSNVVRDAATQVVDVEFSEPVGVGGGSTISMSGGNCVLFFNANLADTATTGVIGDAPNERGNDSCGNVVFYSNEPDPPGLARRSGYTKYWRFTAPAPAGGGTLPTGTRFDLVFSHVVSSSLVIERADGTPVKDFVDPTDIPINP